MTDVVREAVQRMRNGRIDLDGSLRGKNLTDAHAKLLATELKTNTTLRSLDLSKNQIGPEGALALAEALEVNTSLCALDLSYNQIGEIGAKALLSAKTTSLRGLILGHNNIHDEQGNLLSALPKSLIYLCIHNNQFRRIPPSFTSSAVKNFLAINNPWESPPGEIVLGEMEVLRGHLESKAKIMSRNFGSPHANQGLDRTLLRRI